MLENSNIVSCVEDRAMVLRKLKAIGAVGAHAASVRLLTVGGAIKLTWALGVEDVVLSKLRRLLTSEPPAVRHRQGSSAGATDHTR